MRFFFRLRRRDVFGEEAGWFSSPPATTLEKEEEEDAAVVDEVEDTTLSTLFLVRPRMTRERSAALHLCTVSPSLQGVLSDDEKRPMRRRVVAKEVLAELQGVTLPPSPPPTELWEGGKDEEAMLPFLAFPSRDGYKVFFLAENCLCDGDGEVRMRLVSGRRHVASPYGSKVFATSLFDRFPSHLVDPFIGERTPLPDLPVPFLETEPMLCMADEPHVATSSSSSSARSLLTTVIDAETMTPSAEIMPSARPRHRDIVDAYLVVSADDVLLLVLRAGYDECNVFTHVYHAHTGGYQRHRHHMPRR
ncbi:hypothetical protein ABZP36_029247 [Zizania latifolia]